MSYCNDGFQKGVFALTKQIKAQARITPRAKIKARTQKEKGKKELILNLDFQPLKHPMKKDMAMPGNRTTGLPAIGLTSPGLQLPGCFAPKLKLHGWWQPV